MKSESNGLHDEGSKQSLISGRSPIPNSDVYDYAAIHVDDPGMAVFHPVPKGIHPAPH
eukprot:CAMPEP_0170358420 /NCGR_PEP_ID=MMETSP0117_2-20130122/2221_1 /TAXON_ID=400756 /ORGANISM="Durinskia baltica, Strain CSIRO CS-38" /LENGTH=57 /DNA_ID=CAMNT_0010612633 /DNA_START=3497 /DNA_END=3673 /DNA_ORIENTATION=-